MKLEPDREKDLRRRIKSVERSFSLDRDGDKTMADHIVELVEGELRRERELHGQPYMSLMDSPTVPVREEYLDIRTIEGDELRIGTHLYRRDKEHDGRFRCVFCGSGYVAIPLHAYARACDDWNPRTVVLGAVFAAFKDAPFVKRKKLLRRIGEILDRVVLRHEIEKLAAQDPA